MNPPRHNNKHSDSAEMRQTNRSSSSTGCDGNKTTVVGGRKKESQSIVIMTSPFASLALERPGNHIDEENAKLRRCCFYSERTEKGPQLNRSPAVSFSFSVPAHCTTFASSAACLWVTTQTGSRQKPNVRLLPLLLLHHLPPPPLITLPRLDWTNLLPKNHHPITMECSLFKEE